MKVLIAMDSMKGCMSSIACGNAIAAGLKLASPESSAIVRPIADGGEGTVEALVTGFNGTFQEITVMGPNCTPVQARYGIIQTEDPKLHTLLPTAVIEISAAAGISLLDEAELDAMETTTYGVGEMIIDAIQEGCRNFIIGLGGSATNDGGIGMLQALGASFYDKDGTSLSQVTEDDDEDQSKDFILRGRDLELISSINIDSMYPKLSECTFHVACDVNNPLYGPKGATLVFGPQKGAFDTDLDALEEGMKNYAEVASACLSSNVSVENLVDPDFPGCGAAGGLGFAFLYFLHGKLEHGIDIIMRETKLEDYIKHADLVITGEGRLDTQTLMGKTPLGVATLAKKYGIPVIAFAGSIDPNIEANDIPNIDAYFPILRKEITLEEAMRPETTSINLTHTSYQVFRLWLCKKK